MTTGIEIYGHLLPHLTCGFEVPISDAEEREMLAAVDTKHRADPAGRTVSNRGSGWQGELPAGPPFQPLLGHVQSASAELLHAFRISHGDLRVTTMWANINYYKDFNITHRHKGHLSGVYFLQVGAESGDLVLGSVAAYCVDNPLIKLARDRDGRSFLEEHVHPVDRHAVIFSSELNHHVEPNLTDQPRVTIAWNMVVDSLARATRPDRRPVEANRL
jgi:uncharacterized protein (TIGR02466 family)